MKTAKREWNGNG